MTLPPILSEQLHATRSAMNSRPDHAVPPIHRKQIYDAFDLLGRPRTRAWLALITARFVQPIWETKRAFDPLISEALSVTRALLEDPSRLREAEGVAGDAWSKLEVLGYQSKDQLDRRVVFAGEAALSALNAARGIDPFADFEMSDRYTDADLDPWGSDTALWACAAYAGMVGDKESDAKKRLAFWLWWLDESVASAWRQAT